MSGPVVSFIHILEHIWSHFAVGSTGTGITGPVGLVGFGGAGVVGTGWVHSVGLVGFGGSGLVG